MNATLTGRSAAAGGPGFGATVGALAIGQVLSWAVLYYGFSSFVLPMQQSLGWSKPTLMGAFTLGLAAWGSSSFFVGSAIDAGHGRWVMTAGSLLAGLGCLAWSQISAPWMLYAVWALLGCTMSMTLYEPAFIVLTKRYPLRFRQGITALTLLGGFASTLSFPAIVLLFKAGLDWRQALQVLGGALLAVAALHAWALRGPAVVAHPAAPDAQADATLHQALRQPRFWLLVIAFTLLAFNQGTLWAHVVPAFASKPISQGETLAVLMTVGPAQVAGRLLYVWLGRGWSLRRLGGVVLVGLALGLALFALGHSFAMLMAFAVVYGLCNGLVTIVRGSLVPLYFGRSHVGRISGLMSSIGLLSQAAAPITASALLLGLGGYRELMLLLAALGLVAATAYWRAGPPPTP